MTTTIHRLAPPALGPGIPAARTAIANTDRTYGASPGNFASVDSASGDIATLAGAGWADLGLAGATAGRPSPTAGTVSTDTQIADVIVGDGAAWRSLRTGRVV